ncbi:MAG: hypothetical protein ABSC53_09665 [Bacteroidota bacterium]
MKSIKSALLLGFFDWLLPFVVSFAFFQLKDSNYYLFESLMVVVVVFAVVWFATRYFKKVESNFVREGVLLGSLWLIINLALDLMLFLPKSPMQMPLSFYMNQIGIKYLSIPIITIGFGYLKK